MTVTVPTYDEFISPLVLRLARHPDGLPRADAFEAVATATSLTPEQRAVMLPSGRQATYRNRIGWAYDRLKRAGVCASPTRGVWALTPEGIALAAKHPNGLPESEIERIYEVEGDVRGSSSDEDAPVDEQDPSGIAEERVAAIYRDPEQRARCLGFAAEAIEKAHTYGPGVWEVTLQRRRVRINFGMLLSVELSPGHIGFGLVPSTLPPDLKQILDDVGEWSRPFKTEPVTRVYTMPVASFLEHYDRLKPAFAEFLQIAATSALQTPYAWAHSPAFVEYLERAVGRALPRPEYIRRERGANPEAVEAPPERAVAFEGERALFKRVDYELSTLLAYVEMGDIGLPDIQRPFVWSPTKVRDLFDSMFRGFPVGYLLLWENSEAQRGRAIGTGEKSRKIPNRLIVDGQQRLTSLFAVLKGRPVLDEDYRESTIEIAFRPRDARFEVSDAAIRKDPEWIPNISELWSSGKPVRRLTDNFFKTLSAKRALDTADEDAMSHNIDRLFDLQKYPFTALEILPNIDEEAVADIFVRINSEGVKLNQSDFILTMLSVFWDEGRADLERFARGARVPPALGAPPSPFNHFIQVSPDQLLRVSVAVGFHRGRFRSVYQVLRGKDLSTGQITVEKREAQFQILRDAQAKVLDIGSWHLFLGALAGAGFRSGEMISSQTALLYAYAFYLIGKHQCRVEEHELRRLVGRWFFATALTGRYTNSTETQMEADLARVREMRDPKEFVETLDRIIGDSLTEDFWKITLPNELETSSARSPALFAYYAAQNRLNAPVLFSDRKIADLLDPSVRTQRKSLERHHLFARAWLERNRVTDLKLINQTANFAFLEWPDNAKLSDQSPEKYVPTMRARFAPAEWDRMCSLHALPPEWEKLSYTEFLAQRRKLMAAIIRRGFESLSGGDTVETAMPADSTAEERRVWHLIEDVELALRKIVRTKFDERWGATGADERIHKALGDEGWAGILRNREKAGRAYPLTPSADTGDVLDYCYLGQLTQFMMAGDGWALFTKAFRDKRQLEDIVRSITPVRNDRAHFRHVPERELDRCRVACEDLIGLLAKA